MAGAVPLVAQIPPRDTINFERCRIRLSRNGRRISTTNGTSGNAVFALYQTLENQTLGRVVVEAQNLPLPFTLLDIKIPGSIEYAKDEDGVTRQVIIVNMEGTRIDLYLQDLVDANIDDYDGETIKEIIETWRMRRIIDDSDHPGEENRENAPPGNTSSSGSGSGSDEPREGSPPGL